MYAGSRSSSSVQAFVSGPVRTSRGCIRNFWQRYNIEVSNSVHRIDGGVGVITASSPLSGILDLFQRTISGREKHESELETKLLSAIDGVQGRGRGVSREQQEAVDEAVSQLEEYRGVPNAASNPLVDGRWRLIFTTTPGTASPVQRSFVGADDFNIFQDINLFSQAETPTVTNVVDLGQRVGQLRVVALASTESLPREGFVPRRGDGRFLGLNILGVSQTGAPKDPGARIDFQFDNAGFDLEALPFNIPYPVPFRWLGDEVKGWIDVTYLSERLRISRGNKGTLFVLERLRDKEKPCTARDSR